MTETPTTSVLIRCMNEEAHIGRLLTGIQNQRLQPDRVVIVDSGSTDATLSIASHFDVDIIQIPSEEFSFGRALNRGLSETESDYVVLASAHVYPIYDDWLDRLVAPLGDEAIALSYGRQVAPPSSPYSERRLLAQWFPESSHRKVRTPFCNNANAAIKREIWEQVPYDEDLTGLEDLSWGKRVIELGYFLSYVAEAPIVHVHDETFGQIANRYRREAIAHKRIYPDQTLGLVSSARLCATNVFSDLLSAAADRERPTAAADIVRFRVAQFYGTRQGFSQAGPVEQDLLKRFYYPPDRGSDARAGSPGAKVIDYGGAEQESKVESDE